MMRVRPKTSGPMEMARGYVQGSTLSSERIMIRNLMVGGYQNCARDDAFKANQLDGHVRVAS